MDVVYERGWGSVGGTASAVLGRACYPAAQLAQELCSLACTCSAP